MTLLLGRVAVRILRMSDILTRIRRAALRGRVLFTEKALIEMSRDGLTREDVVESLATANVIYKTIRSDSPLRTAYREYLHIICSPTLDGTLVYTKGKLAGPPDDEWFYLLISAKHSV